MNKWYKTKDGTLVNLSKITTIHLSSGKEVRIFFVCENTIPLIIKFKSKKEAEEEFSKLEELVTHGYIAKEVYEMLEGKSPQASLQDLLSQ